MKNITFLLLVVLLCLASACNKDDDSPDNPYGLPDATQTGENTFGCLINGEPWVAGISVIAPGLHDLTMSYDETNTGVFYNNNWSMASRFTNDSINESFVFTANSLRIASSLNLTNNNLRITHRPDLQQFNVYYLDTLQYYLLEITNLDTMNNICSGVFEFYALSNDASDTLYIQEGRFDTKYTPE